MDVGGATRDNTTLMKRTVNNNDPNYTYGLQNSNTVWLFYRQKQLNGASSCNSHYMTSYILDSQCCMMLCYYK